MTKIEIFENSSSQLNILKTDKTIFFSMGNIENKTPYTMYSFA